MRIVSGLLATCLLLSLVHCQRETEFAPRIEQGVLDLSEWSPERDGPVSLQGEWSFYWSSLVPPEAFVAGDDEESAVPPGAVFIQGPSAWNAFEQDGSPVGPNGYATYHLRILLPTLESRRHLFALRLPTFSTAARIYVNNEEAFQVGTVGENSETHVPAYRTGLSVFPVNEKTIDLVVHVSNFSNRKGGLWKTMQFGTEAQIRNGWMGSLFIEIFLLSSIFMIALYHFGLFMNRREDRGSLLFTIVCAVICTRLVFTGETMVTLLFPDFDWEILEKVAYITFYLMPVVATYLMEALEERHRRVLNWIIWPISVLFIIQALVTPVAVFSEWLNIFTVWMIFPIILFVGVNIRAVIGGREGAWISLAGILIGMGAYTNDILYTMRLVDTGYIAPFGLLALIFSQSQLLARLFATTFRSVKKLSEDLQTTNKSYARFVPTAFLNQLGKRDIREIGLGDQAEMEMSVLFSDIRSFTALSESMSPKDNFEFLNSYMGRLSPAIQENNGFIDKYIGDAIMALFPNRAEDALDAAIKMQQVLRQYNHHRVRGGRDPIRAGIGIHLGRLMLGTIGSSERMDGTVISDSVNTASRIEGLTKTYGAYILVSEAVMEKVEDPSRYRYRKVDSVIVKGKSKNINVYEIFDGMPDYLIELMTATQEDFARGIGAYAAGDLVTCRENMEKVLAVNPGDQAALIYLERVNQPAAV